ncbi:MAG: diacylglycerol kinase [Campylobacterota bacterium]
MMHNKPKYTLFKNTTYALSGLVDVVKHEPSFRLQILLFIAGNIVAWNLPIEISYTFVLSISLLIPIMAEIANSAIERVVDLVTKDYHILAKQAKDAGAALVFVSLVTLAAIWLSTLALAFELI